MVKRTTRPEVYAAIERLQRLSSSFQARRVALARRVGLTEQQWRVLEEISTEHFMPSLFAKSHDSTPAAVSKVLRQLLDKGLVSVSIAEADGRQRAYELTPSGQRTMRALRALRQDAIDAVWGDLKAADLERFSSFAETLIARIDAYAARDSHDIAGTARASHEE